MHHEIIATMSRYNCSYDNATDILLGVELARLDAISAMRAIETQRRERIAQELTDKHGWLTRFKNRRSQDQALFRAEWERDRDVPVDWDDVIRGEHNNPQIYM